MMGYLSSMHGFVDPIRNVARDILYILTLLPYEGHAVYLLPNKKLIYIKRADNWQKETKAIICDYIPAHSAITKLIMSPIDASTTIGNYPRIFSLTVTQRTFFRWLKVRKIYYGKLPEYKP